jgi:hypothetical protein
MAQLPSALGSIVNSLRGVDRSTSSFRQAANDNSKSMNRIVKDVVTMTSSQRKEITNLKNSIDDVVDSNKDNAARINSTNSILDQSVALQKDMLSELRVIKRIFLQSSDSGGGVPGAAGGARGNAITSALSSLKNIVGKFGGSILAAAGASDVIGGAEGRFNTATGIPGAGGMGAGDKNLKPANITGNASEAMQFFQSKGWTREQAAGIVGNLQVESGNFAADVLSGQRKGDGGRAVGVAQWHPPRQAMFQRVMGKPLIGSSFKEQLEFVNWELNNSEKKAGDLLRGANSAAAAASIVDQYYERSSGQHRNQRIVNANSLAGGKQGQSGDATPVTSAQQSAARPQQQPAAPAQQSANPVDTVVSGAQQRFQNQTSSPSPPGASAGATDTEKTGKGEDAQRMGGSSAIPGNDIVALGKYLQTQGIRVSEHPDFGGVGKHVPGSAHYSGRAIDINMGYGVREADHPEHGPRFDALAKQLREAGYKVIWRQPGHEGHMHVQVGGGEGNMYQSPGGGGRRMSGAGPMSSPFGEIMSQTGMALNQLSSMGMMGGRGYSGMGMMGGGLMGLAGMAGQFLGNIFGGMGGPRPQFVGAAQEEAEMRPERTSASAATPDFSKAPTPPPRPKITPVDTTASPLSAVASEMQKLSDTAMLQRVQSPTSDKPVEPQPYNIAAMGPQYAGYNDPIRANENMFDSWIKEISAEGKTKFKVPTSYIA